MNHTAMQFQNNKKYNAESPKYVYKSSSPSLISISSYRGIHFVNKMLKSIYLLSISFILFVVLFLYGTNADDEVATKNATILLILNAFSSSRC